MVQPVPFSSHRTRLRALVAIGLGVATSGADLSSARAGDHTCATSLFEPVPATDEAGSASARLFADGPYLLYLNRGGGTYTPGRNDSRSNQSTVVDQEVTIPSWPVSESGWRQVMDCVRAIWRPYNVVITDEDPGDVPHLENVVGGRPRLLGLGPNVGGVSPFARNCGVIDNSVVFTFADLFGANYRAVCETAAHEFAHSFGLDHEYLCRDPMTYLSGCGAKSFQDEAAACGENAPRACACSDTQNSVQVLFDRVGARDGSPAPGSTVTNNPDRNLVGGCRASTGAGGWPIVALVAAAIAAWRRRPGSATRLTPRRAQSPGGSNS